MYSSTHSLTSALDRGEWSASRPGRFTPRERAPGTHWIRGWVGPRAVLDTVVKRKIPSPRWESNPRIPIVQPIAQRYTDWAVTALVIFVWSCNKIAFNCWLVFVCSSVERFLSCPCLFQDSSAVTMTRTVTAQAGSVYRTSATVTTATGKKMHCALLQVTVS
jgi:hypothetical protein